MIMVMVVGVGVVVALYVAPALLSVTQPNLVIGKISTI